MTKDLLRQFVAIYNGISASEPRRVLRYQPNPYGGMTEVETTTETIPCYCVSRFGDNARCPKHGDRELQGKRRP